MHQQMMKKLKTEKQQKHNIKCLDRKFEIVKNKKHILTRELECASLYYHTPHISAVKNEGFHQHICLVIQK